MAKKSKAKKKQATADQTGAAAGATAAQAGKSAARQGGAAGAAPGAGVAKGKRRRRVGPVQSQNSTVDLAIRASSFHGLTSYGNVMVGNRAFEFYNERDVQDYIQIPWDEVDHMAASVMFGGKWIPRFAIMTKQNGNFSFSTRDNKATLRAIRAYVPADRLVRSLSFFDVVKLGVRGLVRRITGKE